MKSRPFYLLTLTVLLFSLFDTVAITPAYAASIITVETTLSQGGTDGDCALHEAIENANDDVATFSDCAAGSGNDTIVFADGLGTVVHQEGAPAITDPDGLTIDGGGDITLSGNNFYQVLVINAGAVVTLNNITIANGYASGDGGGILNDGTLTINNSVITGNSATADTFYHGGGIANTGTLTINNSTISNNSAGDGGGISNYDGTLTITNSTLSGNQAASTDISDAYGGAITTQSGSVTIQNSTFIGNSAIANPGISGARGAAIHNGSSNTLTIVNSTFSDNHATSSGVITNTSIAIIKNSTIVGNSTDYSVGGITNYNGTLSLENTILANNTGGVENIDCWNDDNVTNINNLIENNAGGVNACGTPALTADPNLGPLANNGGSTQTMKLLPGSPAINAGNNTVCSSAPVNNESQNGLTRPQGANCDIGAYELIQTFADVPSTAFAWAQIEAIYDAGITNGCSVSPLNYCSDVPVTRAQMAVFILKGMHGPSYTPPTATGSIFNDVPASHWAAAWIEQFYNEGITAGCGNGNFCPDSSETTRAQIAVFLLKAEHGTSYTPPAATGIMFNDIPSDGFAAAWIEQFATEGITSGCGGGNYCPNNSVTRAQMAVFLQKIFNLPLP